MLVADCTLTVTAHATCGLYTIYSRHAEGVPMVFASGGAPLHTMISLDPRPLPSFLSLAARLSGRGPGTYSHMNDITGRKTVEKMLASTTKMLLCVITVLPW